MHIAQFIQRYPPALGGSEAYTRRLCDYLATHGDEVTVWTTNAVTLEEMWAKAGRGVRSVIFDPFPLASLAAPPLKREGQKTADPSPCASKGDGQSPVSGPLAPPSSSGKGVGWGGSEAGRGGSSVSLRKYPPLHFPARRYVLKALSLLQHRFWQCLTMPCNPVCLAMWRDANRFDGQLDAVHATAFPYSFPIACGLQLARRRGVPFLLTPFLHLGDPTSPTDRTRKQYTTPHLRWLLKQADHVFVQTRAERDAVIALGVAEERAVLQGLGVEASECTGGDSDATRRAWGVSPSEVVIGHLANNSIEKGTVDLLRAAERAWAAGHRFRVILAGPEMPNFRVFWGGFAHKDRVARLGVLTEEQKRDFFAGIDGFALPSRCDSFGLVLLEAWANGKPNIVYRAGGPAEIVRHERDGLQAACGDVDELATCLGRLVADQVYRCWLGNNGLARIAKEFRWEDKLELVRDTIRELVNGQHTPSHRVTSSHLSRISS